MGVSVDRIYADLLSSLAETSVLPKAFEFVLTAATSLDGVDCGGVYVVSDGVLKLMYHVGFSKEFIDAVSVFREGSPQLEFVIKGEPYYQSYSDLRANFGEEHLSWYEHEGLRAIAVLPVIHKNEVIACVNLSSRTQSKFTMGQKNILNSLASQIGGIIVRIWEEQKLAESEHKYKELSKALRQSNEELSEYCHIVSHDIRQPLQSIAQLSKVLINDFGRRPEYTECWTILDMIFKKSSECVELVEDMLKYSEVGKSDLNLVPIDLSTLVTSVLDDLDSVQDIDIDIDTDDCPLIIGDHTLLWQIFCNLIDNAIKFNDSFRKIVRVGWEEVNENHIEVHVKDNGIGIEDDIIGNIFDAHWSRSGHRGGTGMGLAIVYRAANRLEAPLHVISEIGTGSTFFVTFEKVPSK